MMFNLTDAYKQMRNLNPDQAMFWVRTANETFRKLKECDFKPTLCRRRAIKIACEKVVQKYGTNTSR